MTVTEQSKAEQKEPSVSMMNLVTFFGPLASTALLIITTHSLFNAGLARLPNPEIYLSAFAVSKSLMHFIASPELMVRQTVTALVNNRDSYYKVRNFVMIVVGIIVSMLAIVSLTGISRWIMGSIMGLEGKTLDASVIILRVFIFFPICVTVRNFIHGLMIKFRMTPLVTVTTFARIAFVILMVAFIDRLPWIPAAVVAGLLFLCAVLVEGLMSLLGAKLFMGNIHDELDIMERNSVEKEKRILSGRLILSFYTPLVLTALIKSLAMPAINMGLARTEAPEIALSAFAVAWAFGMILFSPAGMFHQVPLNFIEYNGSANVKIVRKFAIYLAILLSSALAVVSFTDAGYYILVNIIGVTGEIADKAVDVLKFMIFIPPLVVAREFYWGILMKRRMTRYVGKGKAINITALIIAVVTMMFITPANPAVIGVIGMIVCETAEFLYLFIVSRKNSVME